MRPGSAEDGDKRLLALKRDLIDMANDGYFDNWPDIKARVLDDYNPLVELAIAGLIAPGDSQRIVANKIVAEFCFVPLKTEGAAIDNSRQPINITIATWAAAAQPKAIEHRPIDVPAIDYTSTDKTIRSFRQSPPRLRRPASPLIKRWRCAPMAEASCDPHPLSSRSRMAGGPGGTISTRARPLYDVVGGLSRWLME